MKRFLLIILQLIFVFCAYAQDEFVVHGYVRDSEGNLMPHVDVHNLELTKSTLTDSVGYYSLDLKQDSVWLEFTHVGYITERILYTHKKYKVLRMNIILKEDIQMLGDISIQGGRLQYKTERSLQIKDLEELPLSAVGGIETLVKTMQGVSSNNELSSQYSVRGGSYDENSVYVNGIEVYRSYLVRTGEQEGLSFVNPDMTGAVDFSAGGFDALYGDKLSSVLDITYRKPMKFEAGIAASFMGVSGYIGHKTDKFSQLHGVRYKNTSFLLGTLQTSAEYNPNFIDYQTNLVWTPTDNFELSFLGNFSQNTYNFVPESRTTAFGSIDDIQNFTIYFNGQEQDVFRTYFGALSAKYKPDDNWNLGLSFSVFNTNEKVNYDISGEYWLNSIESVDSESSATGVGNYFEHARNKMNAMVYKAAFTADVNLTKNNKLLFGVDFTQEIISEQVQEWEMRDSSGYSVPSSPDELKLFYSLNSNNSMNESRVSAYIQDEYKLNLPKGGIMNFTGGIRLNYWTFNNELTISPRVTVAFFPDIKPDIRFRLSVGLYYQSPSFKEVKDTVSINGNLTNYLNRDIKAQQSAQFVFGMDYFYNLWNMPFKLSFEAYYKNLQNIIPYNLDNVSINYLGGNDAYGHAGGIDVKLFGELLPGVDSWISFSLMSAVENVKNDGYGYIPRPTDQLYNISVFFQDYVPRLPQYRVHLLFTWAQGLPVGPPRSERYMSSTLRMPDYRRVDIGVSRVFEKGKDPWMGRGFFKPFKRILVAFEVLNLFGFQNVNSYYWVTDINNRQHAVPNYLTGRQFNLKLKFEF